MAISAETVPTPTRFDLFGEFVVVGECAAKLVKHVEDAAGAYGADDQQQSDDRQKGSKHLPVKALSRRQRDGPQHWRDNSKLWRSYGRLSAGRFLDL